MIGTDDRPDVQDRPSRGWRKAIIALTAVIAVAACVVFWLWPSGYDSMIRRLNPNMTHKDVVGTLGEPWGNSVGPVYKKKGEHTVLMVLFDNNGHVRGWLILELPEDYRDGSGDAPSGTFKITKAREFSGPMTSPAGASLITTIYTADQNGKPYGPEQ